MTGPPPVPAADPPVPSRSLAIAVELAEEFRRLPPGARVPGDHELMARFGVGRAAARAAVGELERRLLVRRVKGSGTYVNRRIDYVLSRDRRPSWRETVTAAGGVPRSLVRDLAVTGLPPDVAARLELPAGTPTHRLRRVSYVDDLLASCSDEWVPVATVPELRHAMGVGESLDDVLRQLGHVLPRRAWSRVSLDVPPADALADLQMTVSAPVWLVESMSRDATTRRPIMCSHSWMRADVVRVVVELGDTD